MPAVKKSTFKCPECGSPMRVARTRSATAQRLIRFRVCSAGHRVTTREIPVNEPATVERAIGATRVEILLRQLADDLGIAIDSNSTPQT